ncbi:MAG: type II secretion system F family protein [Burkholderiales bacterium]|nr:type II secretion system F family protein [Burkholderiales bacterium]
MGVVLAAAFLLLLGATGWVVLEMRRDALRERLLFGLEGAQQEEREDLSAGDYGLRGPAWFFYHLSGFLSTWRGRVTVMAVGAAAGFAGALASGTAALPASGVAVASGFAGLAASVWLLRMRANARTQRIKRELPNALELLAAVMEGGQGFEAALSYLLREADAAHPLYFDLNVMNEAMRRGQRRTDALRLWAQRCNVLEVSDVTSALIQADISGGSLGRVLHHHARALFRDNEAEIQRRAERLPIRMLFPMLFTIFPAILVVAAMPSWLRVVRVLEQVLQGMRGL